MSFSEIRPILSAIIGIAIGRWLQTKWARWVPVRVGAKERKQLLNEYRHTIRVAKVLGLLGICAGLLCYLTGWLSKYDWRGLGLGFGLVSFLPLVYMAGANVAGGPALIKECLVAFAISEKTPVGLLFTLMGLMLLGGIASAVSLFL